MLVKYSPISQWLNFIKILVYSFLIFTGLGSWYFDSEAGCGVHAARPTVEDPGRTRESLSAGSQ